MSLFERASHRNHYQLRPETAPKRPIEEPEGPKTTMQRLAAIPVARILAFAIGLAFYSGSLLTNIEGVRLLMPGNAIFAFVFAMALQGALVLAAFYSAQQPSEPIDGNWIDRWYAKNIWEQTKVACFSASLVFSIIGCASYYSMNEEREHRHRQEQNLVRTEASKLANEISEARVLGRAKLTNRKQAAESIIARVRAKDSEGSYVNPAVPAKMVAGQQAVIDGAQRDLAAWNAFQFEAQSAISKASTDEGFAELQAAYSKLGNLVGTLSKTELGDYQMPKAPASGVMEKESSGDFLPIWRAVTVLSSIPQFILIVGFALLLEVIPVKLFEAAGTINARSPQATMDAEGDFVSDEPRTVHVFGQPITETEAGLRTARPFGFQVASAVPTDQAMVDLVNGFSSEYRVAVQAGATTLEEIEAREAALAEISGRFQANLQTRLADANLKDASQLELEKLRRYVAICAEMNVEPAVTELAVLEVARRISRDFGYEDATVLVNARQESAKTEALGNQGA